jgi:hypothetical protein
MERRTAVHRLLQTLLAAGAAAALAGCSTADSTTAGPIVTDFGSDSTAARLRSTGAVETTLSAFCKAPPKTSTPQAADAIKASCRPQVLSIAGDASVFEKGGGLYHVVFKRPVRNGDICPTGTTPQSLCGNFSAGDTMHASRIDAG